MNQQAPCARVPGMGSNVSWQQCRCGQKAPAHACVAAALTLMPKTTAASDSQHLVPSYCASTSSQGPSEACKRPIVPLGTRWDSLPAPSQVGWSVLAIYIATSCACQRCRQLAALACCRLCSPRQSRSRCTDHRLLTLVAHPIRYVTRPRRRRRRCPLPLPLPQLGRCLGPALIPSRR